MAFILEGLTMSEAIDRINKIMKRARHNRDVLQALDMIRMPLIVVVDKCDGTEHVVGTDVHDLLECDKHDIRYYNMQCGDGTHSENYEFKTEKWYDHELIRFVTVAEYLNMFNVAEIAKYPKAEDVEQADIADNVNHPDHYCQGGIKVIDYLKDKMTADEFKGFLRGNVLKYVSRAGAKGREKEDYEKALWYLNRLIQEAENE